MLSPRLFSYQFLLKKTMLQAITEQTAAEWRSFLKPSLFQPSFSIVKNNAPGHHQANGRRVAIIFKALSFSTSIFYCKKQGSRPSPSKRPQSDDSFRMWDFKSGRFVETKPYFTARHRIQRIYRIYRIYRKRRSELQLGPHRPHAPGARMTVVEQTPSNYV